MLVGAAISAWLMAGVAEADPASPAAEESLDEAVIVTGERVLRSVRKTSSSVEVVSRQQLEATVGADRIEQALELVPNVEASAGGAAPVIRGQDATGPTRDLPAFLGGTRPRTTLIVDGRAVSYSEFVFGAAPLWDVDRVEVFRSPQTTTQGQNSIAGAIFVETRDPSFTSESHVRAMAGNYRTRQLSLSATAPLSSQLAMRVAGDFRYSHTASKIDDRTVGADPNHDVYGLLRAKLLAVPTALPGSRFEFTYSHSQSQMPQIEGIRPPFERRRDPSDGYGVFRTNVDSLTGKINVELGAITVDTIMSFGDARVQRFAPAGLGQTKIHNRDWSGESVLHWAPNPDLIALIGVSYRAASADQLIDLSQLSGIGRFKDKQDAFGIFGEVTWTLLPRLELTGGLRFQRDGQTRDGALAADDGPIDLDYDRAFHAWLPKVSLAYDLSGGVRVGALVQKAYNPGGVTLRFDTGAPDPFDAETLWDYELFARVSSASGRLSARANLFYYDIENAQRARSIVITAPTGSLVTFADLFNVPEARTRGAELTVDWHPFVDLSLRGAVGLLDAKITKAEGIYAAYENKKFQRSPNFSASVSADWRPLPDLSFSVQVHHNNGFFSDDLEQANRQVQGWTKVNVSSAYDLGRIQAQVYVRNLFDKFYLTYLSSATLATAGDPREFGVGVAARF